MTATHLTRSVRTAHEPSSMSAVSGRRAQSARYTSNKTWRDQQQHGAVARSVRTAHDPGSTSAVPDHRAQSARYASNRIWRGKRRQRGVVAIEFALMFTFGLLPLLLLTFTGVMIFAAKQSLTLAAADGARAALQYQASSDLRIANAESVAKARMHWLYQFNESAANVVAKSTIATCNSGTPSKITVTTSYDYRSAPLFPNTEFILDTLTDKATVQLPPSVCNSSG